MGSGMQAPDMARELNSGHGRHPLVGKHQRQLPAIVSQSLQPAQPHLRGGGADHLVVGPVALAQLPSRALGATAWSSTAIKHRPRHDRNSCGLSSPPTLSGDGRAWPVAGSQP
jgi:hypothetical protein